MKTSFLTVGLLACTLLVNCKRKDAIISQKPQYGKQLVASIAPLDVDSVFIKNHTQGAFIIYDAQTKKYWIYNDSIAHKAFSPASTFKIANSIIALETGVATGANYLLKWDGVKRDMPLWNQDQTLESAYKNSCVWYYQELARHIGAQRMKDYLAKFNYGNQRIGEAVDKFWLNETLLISPMQQVDFLRKLHDQQLPLSNNTYNTMQQIMLMDSSNSYRQYAKTGWGNQGLTTVGWYVGYYETNNGVYYFANCIQENEPKTDEFITKRKTMVNEIMRTQGFIN